MTTVLSVQSSVAAGHVGNSAAVFCLQRMGVNVFPVDTLQFSNHAGAPFQGDVFPADHVARVLNGIETFSHFDDCRAVLSGYIGTPETGTALLNAVDAIKRKTPDAFFCCDPVIGDDGRGVFVKPEVAAFFETAAGKADILTPNVFELEFLSKNKLNFVQNILDSARNLVRTRGIGAVLVTGMRANDFPRDKTGVLGVSATEAFLIETPLLPFSQPLTGTGDCFSALFTGRFLQTRSLPASLSHATSALFGIIENTRENGTRSLALVESQSEIVRPSRLFDVQKIF